MKLTEQGGGASFSGARARITIISPGEGSSGYYSPEVIAEAAPLFTDGTQMYLDHATESERAERGVRSLKDLVGIIDGPAEISPTGALVAEVKIMPEWREFIREAHPYIGVSISASGEIEESEQGRVVKRLTAVESVDFVAKAGRGGRIDALLESANIAEATARDKEAAIRAATPAYVADYDEAYIYLEAASGSGHMRQPYTWDGATVTLTGSPEPVTRETIYRPQTGGLTEGERMSVTITEAEHKSLTENAARVAELEAQIKALQEELKAEKAKTTEAKEAAVKAQATAIVEEAFQGINAPAGKARLIEAATVEGFNPEDFRTTVAEAAAEYAPASPVRGMGADNTAAQTLEEAEKAILTNLGVTRG